MSNETFAPHYALEFKEETWMRNTREFFTKMESRFETAVPPCRERALAITNLQQAYMWIEKALEEMGINDA